MKIEAILFDLGGVFTDSPFGVMDEISRELGSTKEQVLGIIFGAYHEDTDHPWHRLERGELSLEIARQEIIEIGAQRGLDVDPFEVLRRIGSGGFEDRLPLVERTRRLRSEGYKTALVTNNFAEVRAGWRAMLPIDELFDVVVDSSEVGMRKPDPAIYHHALELLGAQAEHSVFLDDFAGNVDAAVRLGMRGIVVGSDIHEVIGRLDAMLEAG